MKDYEERRGDIRFSPIGFTFVVLAAVLALVGLSSSAALRPFRAVSRPASGEAFRLNPGCRPIRRTACAGIGTRKTTS